MIIKRNELYDVISNLCPGEYSIGLHGIDYNRMEILAGTNHDNGLSSILANGLKVFSGRTINGTVKFFGRLDLVDDMKAVSNGLNEYRYYSNDYIIVALPVILKTKNDDKLYQGYPNFNTIYHDYIGTRGYEVTSLADKISPMRKGSKVVLPEYILGYFRVLDDEYVDFTYNSNHICDNGGFIGEFVYDEMINLVSNDILSREIPGFGTSMFTNPDNIHEGYINKISKLLEENLPKNYYLLETLDQLSNEKRLVRK